MGQQHRVPPVGREPAVGDVGDWAPRSVPPPRNDKSPTSPSTVSAISGRLGRQRSNGIVHRVAKPRHDCIDIRGRRRCRAARRHVVAAHAVDRAAHRVDREAARERRVARPDRAAAAPGRTAPCCARSATSSIAQNRPRPRMSPTWRWLPRRSRQPVGEPLAHRAHVGQQVVLADHLLHRERGGAGDRMRLIGVAVHEAAGAGAERLDDASARSGCRRSAGSRRPAPWRPPGCRARCPPAPRRASCRCGPCRTSPRPGSAARRGGRRSRASRGNSRAARRRSPVVAPTTGSAQNATTRSGPSALELRLQLVGQPRDVGVVALAVVAGSDRRKHGADMAERVRTAAARTARGASCCRRPPARPACCRDSSAGGR